MHITEKQKKLIIVLLLAFVVGFIYVLYHVLLFLWYRQAGDNYFSVLPLANDGYPSTFWARLRELSDGYLRIADSSLFEYRHGLTTLHPLLNPFLYYPLFVIGGLRGVAPLADFVFAVIAFLLLYKLAHILTERFSLSLAFASIFVMTANLPFLLMPRSLNEIKDLIKFFFSLPIFAQLARLS